MVWSLDAVSRTLTLSQHLSKAFEKVTELLKQNLATPTTASSKSGMNTSGEGVVAMTQDLLQILLPFLGDSNSRTLFELSCAEEVLENKDTGVQKRGYKILSKLIDSRKIQVTPEDFIQQLEGKADGVSAAAKKVCYTLFFFLSRPAPEIHRIDCICSHR